MTRSIETAQAAKTGRPDCRIAEAGMAWATGLGSLRGFDRVCHVCKYLGPAALIRNRCDSLAPMP